MKDATWQGQLENIIEAVVAGVVVLDKDGRFVYMNAEAEKMLGLTRSDIIGRTYKDTALRIIATDGELVRAKDLPYARIMATGEPLHDVELTIERPDGVRVMVSISVTPFHDDKGTLKGMVASLIDITEQKRAERALVESEARLQAILDNTTAIIFIKDTEGRYLLVNRHQVGLLHTTKEEVLGKTDYDFFSKEKADLLRANDRRVIATGGLLEFEEEVPLEGGVHTYVSIKFPLRDTKGAIYGVCGISTDITERKRAEEELKRAYDELEARIEERTAELMTANTLLKQEIRERERAAKEIRESRRQVIDILESITDGFFALDNEWRFTYVNYKATQLLGRRKEELLFRNIWEAFPEAAGTKFYQEFNRAKEEMVPVSFEEFYVPLNKWFEVHVYPYRNGLSGYFSDVTERKRVEEQIIFQASLLDQVRNAVIATDVEGRIIYWNKYAETLYRWKAEEAIGKTVLETITPPSGREIGEEIIKGMSTSGQWEGEFIVQRKDGSTFLAYIVDAAIRDAQGNIIGFVGLSVDITERKKAEEELQFKSLLLDNAMDSIFVRDLEGRTLYVNEAAYKTRGYTREELMSLTFQELDTPEYAKLTKDRIEFLKKTGSAIFESAHIKKDGTVMPVEIHARIVEFGDSKVIISVVRDITKRKKIEERLKLFSEAVEEAPDGVQITDLNGRIIYSNKAVEEIYGYSPEDLAGKHVNEMNVDPEFASKVILPSIQETGRWTGEVLVKRKSGGEFPIWLTASIVKDSRGDPIALVGIIRDITEQKRAKELSDALNSLNAAINSTLDFDEIMRRVIVESTKAIGAETAAIDLREDDRWTIRYVHGLSQELIGMSFTDKDFKGSVLAARTREPIAVNDTSHDELANRELVEKYSIRSILIVPLVVRENAIGTLAFHYHSAAVAFTDAQVDFARKLAASASLALENARLYSAERNIADTLQEALLTIPEKMEGVEFGYLYRSATEATKVGGDFYDLFEIEHDKVGIVIGDVSGKGLEAATLTSLVKNTIKAYAYEDISPASIMAKVNEVVRKASAPAMFITVFFGILDTTSGALLYCNAGHPPGILKRKTQETDLLMTSSPVIGAFTGLHFIDDETTLDKGDVLILYTDGVIEARCKDEFFGEERLVNVVKELRSENAKHAPRAIYDEVMRYANGVLSDDVAFITIALEGDIDAED